MCHSPLRTIHPAPNLRNQEVEISEKYVWELYRLMKSIRIKCANMQMSLFSRNSIPKPKTCRITLTETLVALNNEGPTYPTTIHFNLKKPTFDLHVLHILHFWLVVLIIYIGFAVFEPYASRR